MPWTPTYTPLTLKEKLTFTARKLRETMATQHKLLGIALPLLCLLDARFSSLINRLLDAIAATPGPHRARSPRTQPDSPRESRPPAWLRNWHTTSLGPPPPLPRRFGILRRTFAHYTVNGFIAQIEHLLTTPDMQEAIARNPAIPRILRPLCHLCGINPQPSSLCPNASANRAPNPHPNPSRNPRCPTSTIAASAISSPTPPTRAISSRSIPPAPHSATTQSENRKNPADPRHFRTPKSLRYRNYLIVMRVFHANPPGPRHQRLDRSRPYA
ncbi:hypothetical protein [Acidiphilium acidophilum]|uniref:Transposase n=1 Tax=Acidiphilium acidophilum TaxID=76588 RepID=A0AAW9DST5_ACIAO|nr:hypothetical protein [Acidiphilium acidophilum]MDX5932154.1 hypothetical protein [Acidiphilium acidophilum]